MAKWEYKIIDSTDIPGGGGFLKSGDRDSIETYFNQLGESGWEIINLDFRALEGRLSFSGLAKREVNG